MVLPSALISEQSVVCDPNPTRDSGSSPRLVGGVFALEDLSVQSGSSPPFTIDGAILLANAASSLFLLVERLRPPRVWLPSYLCDSLTKAVAVPGVAVSFYEMNANLAGS